MSKLETTLHKDFIEDLDKSWRECTKQPGSSKKRKIDTVSTPSATIIPSTPIPMIGKGVPFTNQADSTRYQSIQKARTAIQNMVCSDTAVGSVEDEVNAVLLACVQAEVNKSDRAESTSSKVDMQQAGKIIADQRKKIRENASQICQLKSDVSCYATGEVDRIQTGTGINALEVLRQQNNRSQMRNEGQIKVSVHTC
jgi:hypothetical protein